MVSDTWIDFQMMFGSQNQTESLFKGLLQSALLTEKFKSGICSAFGGIEYLSSDGNLNRDCRSQSFRPERCHIISRTVEKFYDALQMQTVSSGGSRRL